MFAAFRPDHAHLRLMCGRFTSSLPPEQVARLFRTTNPVPNAPARYNAAPTQDMLVVRFNPETHQRSLDSLRWGLVPHWAKDLSIGSGLINARAESIAEKPAFRDAFRRRRCLVPADGFFEWHKDTKPKQPFLARLQGGAPFGFAGLWENWHDPASGAWIRTFTIITTDANERLAPIHNRMPVIIAPENYARWLGEEAAEAEELHAMLKPFPSDRMEAYPVGRAVNDVRNDDASLLEPVLLEPVRA
jgi:putative SOS response-associated peptidase YedK